MSRRRAAESTKAFDAGRALVSSHPLFRALCGRTRILDAPEGLIAPDGWCLVQAQGLIYAQTRKRAAPEEWAYAIAHVLLHLGFDHFRPEHLGRREWSAACCAYVDDFLAQIKFGRCPYPPPTLPARDERQMFAAFTAGGIPRTLEGLGMAGGSADFTLAGVAGGERGVWTRPDHRKVFTDALASGLRDAVTAAVEVAAGRREAISDWKQKDDSLAVRARAWFINRYPLLGALAAHFEIIEDTDRCRMLDIRVAAIDVSQARIYINPAAGLTEEETRFVMAHEFLHAALRHHARCLGRDPYIWNIACDYAINAWLIQMGIGTAPSIGMLHDPELAGLSAEEIYARIATDLRRLRKIATFRGTGSGDMLDTAAPEWWLHGRGVLLDELYRNMLAQGLTYHEEQGRGFLPGGLIEEIRALMQPPILWDVKLAEWFDEQFQPIERVRSYARPSRRQSSNPMIPQPRWVFPEAEQDGRTFGVLIDTSMSMPAETLGKALGAIASYAASRDVANVRLVYCDAQPYDEGYVAAEDLLDRVQVKGRGGTVLQPGIDLLDRARDFPADAPILVITDGACDVLQIRREHAFLMPLWGSLPFRAKGPVFRIDE